MVSENFENTDGVQRARILDIPVDLVDYDSALDRFRVFMDNPGCDMIVTPNSEIVVNATKDPALKDLIEHASLIIPDGIGLVKAAKIKHLPLQERVTGVDFLTRILGELEATGKSIFLLGSKPANEERASVADMAAAAMKERFPGLVVAGTNDGYFKAAEEAALVRKINESGADFLCVALGSPKQEKFIYEHKSEFTSVKAAIGVGGTLDVWAGTVKSAPEFLQNHGLEWLYRFLKEPVRFKRVLQLPVFMLKVMFTK